MKLSIIIVAIVVFCILNTAAVFSLEAVAIPSFYTISLKTIQGKDISMSEFKGKTLLIVNVASKCGFTSQYKDLETLYQKYQKKGFVILGFPCNNFLWQEPGSNEEIQKFCQTNYQISFPLFSKIDVKGKKQHPLYQYLTSKKSNPEFSGNIKWNFTKFLISKEGKIINRFDSSTNPLDPKVIESIEKIL